MDQLASAWKYHQFLTPVVRINFILDRPVLSIVHDILAVYQTHDLTMVLTAAQMTTFFEHANQMGIPHTTVLQLQSEGITLVSDLVDFNKDSLQQLADNLRCPGGRELDPNPAAQPGSTIPTPPFVFGAKSQRRIAVACDLVKYYVAVGCDLTVANLQWSTILITRSFLYWSNSNRIISLPSLAMDRYSSTTH